MISFFASLIKILSDQGASHVTIIEGLVDKSSEPALMESGNLTQYPDLDRLRFCKLFLFKSLKFIFKTIVKLRKHAFDHHF